MTNNAYIIPYIYAANAIPEMVAEFGQSVAINWIPLSYNLCYSVSLLLFGRFADVFGRRYFVVGAHVLAVLGTAVSATAHNANTIVGGQVLTGLAAAVQSSFTVWLAERLFTISPARPPLNANLWSSSYSEETETYDQLLYLHIGRDWVWPWPSHDSTAP